MEKKGEKVVNDEVVKMLLENMGLSIYNVCYWEKKYSKFSHICPRKEFSQFSMEKKNTF